MDPMNTDFSGRFVKTTHKKKNCNIHVEKERKISKNVKIISYGPDENTDFSAPDEG